MTRPQFTLEERQEIADAVWPGRRLYLDSGHIPLVSAALELTPDQFKLIHAKAKELRERKKDEQ